MHCNPIIPVVYMLNKAFWAHICEDPYTLDLIGMIGLPTPNRASREAGEAKSDTKTGGSLAKSSKQI